MLNDIAGKYHTKPSIWTKIVYAISICPFIQIFLCFMIFLWFGSPRHDMWYSISTILTAISIHFGKSTFCGFFIPIYVYVQSKELNFKSLIFRHWFSICQFRDSFFDSYYLFKWTFQRKSVEFFSCKSISLNFAIRMAFVYKAMNYSVRK